MCGGGAESQENTTDAALAAFGLVQEKEDQSIEHEEQFIEVWSDNLSTLHVFESMSSQWNVGAHGLIGLKYEVLPMIFRLQGIKRQQHREIFNGLRVMENAALTFMNGRKYHD